MPNDPTSLSPQPLTEDEREHMNLLLTSQLRKIATGEHDASDAQRELARLLVAERERDSLARRCERYFRDLEQARTELSRLRAENTALEADRDNLKRQIDWLAEWLIEHTDEPKSSYGAVEAAINAMAGFQRHIDRSAEVWAQNRQDLEKLRAENATQATKLADAEAGLKTAREEHGGTCYETVFWWDGEYEGECELAKYHGGPHFDGMHWWDDDRQEVEPPTALDHSGEGQTNGNA